MESVTPICRICLNESKDYVNFNTRLEFEDFNNEETNVIDYLQCLRACTNLPIKEDDGGPQSFCEGCADELRIAFKFLQKAKNSQAILEESWVRTNCSEEISIEKCVDDDIDLSNSYENVMFDYDCNEVSNNSISSSTECDKFSEYFIDEDGEEDTKMENVVINESQPKEYSHETESIKEDNETPEMNAPATYTFIPRKYKCHICDRAYTTKNLLKVHLSYHKRRNVGSKPYNCKICGECFSLQRYLTQHMIEHQDCREIHKCPYCDKEYVSKTALTSHKRIHQGEGSLNCNECGKQFTGSYEFNVHLRFHRREKQKIMHKCNLCHKEYSSIRYLSQHIAAQHNDRKIHKCNFCNKQYVSITALSNHKQRLHQAPTECTFCGEQFAGNRELKMHLRFHKAEYLFKCTMCEKEFKISQDLIAHMWQHEGIKFECEVCSWLFGSAKALREHSYTCSKMAYP